jgi:NAD(P)-dependent dehydrogenase (short-subunit alcohol dehydrogenase family)
MRFTNKIALITAAANGIGRATAEIMAREGAILVCVDNHPDRLESAVAALGPNAHPRLCDALDQCQVDAVVAGVVSEFGRIDILVNAVGGSTIIARPSAVVEEHSLEDWKRVIAFNLDGTFLFTHAVVPVMKRQKSGKIVNLASIAGRGMSVASGAAYATAKGGIIALTRKLAFELGPFGININAIAPSLTLTERIRPHWNQRSPEAQTAQVEATPLRRVAEASDQAKVICFLASSDADFVTGLTIDVTGGQ